MAIVNPPDEGNSQAVDQPQVDDVPEQYKGKTPKELMDMHKALERRLGQQSEELGSLRKLAEQSIKKPEEFSQDAEEVDFFTDPERAINRIIEQKLRPYEESAKAQSIETVQKRLSADFPGWEDTVKGEPFQEWVAKSKVRVNLFMQADSADYDAAAELLSTWNELGNAKANKESTERKAVERDRKLRAVTTEKGSAGIDPRKILQAADLRELRQKNPSRYNDLLPDIRKAYAEGRVRR